MTGCTGADVACMPLADHTRARTAVALGANAAGTARIGTMSL